MVARTTHGLTVGAYIELTLRSRSVAQSTPVSSLGRISISKRGSNIYDGGVRSEHVRCRRLILTLNPTSITSSEV